MEALSQLANKYPDNKSEQTKAVLDYVLTHARQDERLYLTVDILGMKMSGLLDSGAQRQLLVVLVGPSCVQCVKLNRLF